MDRQLVHPTTVPATFFGSFFGSPFCVLAGFNLERLFQVGCKVRDIFQQHAKAPERQGTGADCCGLRRQLHYALTIAGTELTPVERQAMGASDVDQMELEI